MKIVQTKINDSSYNHLDISTLSIDEVLLFDIFIKRENDYVIILEAGTTLSSQLFKMLKTHTNLYISSNVEKKKSKTLFKLIQNNKNDFQKTLKILYQSNNGLFMNFLASSNDIIEVDLMNEVVKSAVYLIKENSNYMKETMQHFSLDYSLAYHSLHVSLYAIHLGNVLKLNNEELTQLGIEGLLHDIGSKKVNDAIKNKEAKLDIQELEEMNQHPTFSREIAQKNHINNPYTLDAIIHHHEAHDGSGYPHNLTSKDIHTFASILGISDSFDALTNDRAYRKKYTSFEALKIMIQEEGMVNKLHPEYLKVFLHSFIK